MREARVAEMSPPSGPAGVRREDRNACVRLAGLVHELVGLRRHPAEETVLLAFSVQVVLSGRIRQELAEGVHVFHRVRVHQHPRALPPRVRRVFIPDELVARDVGLPQQLLPASHHFRGVLEFTHKRRQLQPREVPLHRELRLQLVQLLRVLLHLLDSTSPYSTSQQRK